MPLELGDRVQAAEAEAAVDGYCAHFTTCQVEERLAQPSLQQRVLPIYDASYGRD